MTERRSPRTDLARLPDWESRLAKLANEWRHRPYAYGVTDCGRFMLDAVECVTGTTLLAGVTWPRGWLGVAKFMIANGWESVEDTMDDLLPAMPTGESRRGDVVSFSANEERHLAVRVGDAALSPSVNGLVVIGAGIWCRAWRVG